MKTKRLIVAATALSVAAVAVVYVARRKRRNSRPDPEEAPQRLIVAPSRKTFFGTHDTWASAPRRVASFGTAARPVPRPSTAEEWLALGWSLDTAATAWVTAGLLEVQQAQ